MASQVTQRSCSYCKTAGHNANNSCCPKKLLLLTTMYGFWRLEFTNEDASSWINTLTAQEVKFACLEMRLWTDDPHHGILYHRSLLAQEILRWRRNVMASVEIYPPYMEINDVGSYYLEQYIKNRRLEDTFYDLPLEKQNYIRRVVYNRDAYKFLHERRYSTDPNLTLGYHVLELMENALLHSELERRTSPKSSFFNYALVFQMSNDEGLLFQEREEFSQVIYIARQHMVFRPALMARVPSSLSSKQRWTYNVQVKDSAETQSFECGICYESTPPRFQCGLNCGHAFCFLCIQQQSLTQSKKNTPPCCGFCREPIQILSVSSSIMKLNFRRYVKK